MSILSRLHLRLEKGTAHCVQNGGSQRGRLSLPRPAGRQSGQDSWLVWGPPEIGVLDRMQEQWRIWGHVVGRTRGVSLNVEECIDESGILPARANQEEGRHHAANLQGRRYNSTIRQCGARQESRASNLKDPRREWGLGVRRCTVWWAFSLARVDPSHDVEVFDRFDVKAEDMAREGRDIDINLAEISKVVSANESARTISHGPDVKPSACKKVVGGDAAVCSAASREAALILRADEARLHQRVKERALDCLDSLAVLHAAVACADVCDPHRDPTLAVAAHVEGAAGVGAALPLPVRISRLGFDRCGRRG
eukprot:scaffold33886_cov32-Tisochrysis_lutea.AAC.1